MAESNMSLDETIADMEFLEKFFSNPKISKFFTSPTISEEKKIEVIEEIMKKYLSKGWKTCDIEYQPYFVLSDLREAFGEWSAYGAGVPLVLDSEDDVVQYYVPSLSGIQLYVELQ